jgi:hypothetical protein
MGKLRILLALAMLALAAPCFCQLTIPEDTFKTVDPLVLPASQPDDALVVSTTAGAMRRALAYQDDDLALRDLVNLTLIPAAVRLTKSYNYEITHPRMSVGQKASAVLAVIGAGLLGYAIGHK